MNRVREVAIEEKEEGEKPPVQGIIPEASLGQIIITRRRNIREAHEKTQGLWMGVCSFRMRIYSVIPSEYYSGGKLC